MLTRWNDLGLGALDRSFFGFGDLRREMDRLLEGYEHGSREGRAPRGGALDPRTAWPRVHLRDAGTQLELRAEVPGLSEKDIDIQLERDSLTLRGERKIESPEGYAAQRQERGSLAFARSFTLPCRIDGEKVVARLDDGVLEVILPKAVEEHPRQISIRVN